MLAQAASQNLQEIAILLSAVAIAVAILNGIGCTWIMTKVRRIESLEERVLKTTSELTEQKLKTVEQKLTPITEQLGRILERLESGETEFKGLSASDHRLEMKLTERLAESRESLKDFMRDTFAEKEDVVGLRSEVVAMLMAVKQNNPRGQRTP